jgi:DNA polymerase-1
MSDGSPRLYLVDGSSYLYRAFFALPPLTAPNGLPTNAVYGFTTMLLKLLKEARPEYLGIVFDAPGATFRDDLFAEYKAHRPSAPDDLKAQIPLVHKIVQGFRLRTLTVPGVEADDVIATLVDAMDRQGARCVVVTGDKDLMQLVGPRVTLWDTMRDRVIDSAAVEARLGVPPARVVDVMALMGDSVDNIPGVKGIGEKTAVALVREFGDLEGILAHLSEVEQMKLRGAKKVAERLREDAEIARLSRALATVRRDVPLETSLDDFRVQPPDATVLRPLFVQLGFQTLARQLAETEPPVSVHVDVAASAADLKARIGRARADGWLAMATVADAGPAATTAAREIVLCAADASPLRVSLDDPTLFEALRGELRGPDLEIVAHDLKRDLLRLEARGLTPDCRAFDLMIASYLLEATASHGLEELAAEVLGVRLEAFRDGSDSAAAGAALMGRLRSELRSRLAAAELERLFYDVEMPLVGVLASMERRGMLLDLAYLGNLGAEFGRRLEALMAEIYALAGVEFNINSPPQLRSVLFEKLGLSKKGVRKGKTGYSTDVDVLNRLAAEHPLPARILDYRALAKLKSTYVDGLLAAVNPTTRRLHTTLNQTVAATGRLSSSEPNLQNIPIRGEEGRRIRAAFLAPPGHLLVAADYSQIELRVLAHLSGDPALVEAFVSGQDIHTRTAAEVFDVHPDLVPGDMRRAAKVINFGILYGMGPQRLSHELGIPLSRAQEYIESYFRRYAGVRRYMQGVIAVGREKGFVETVLGRRRSVPELRSPDRSVVQAAERVATNTPVQGSAADIIKLAMVAVQRRLAREGLRAWLLLQVHDELLLEVAESDMEAARRALEEEMEGAMRLTVPLRVDIGTGKTWAEAH